MSPEVVHTTLPARSLSELTLEDSALSVSTVEISAVISEKQAMPSTMNMAPIRRPGADVGRTSP
jgi:hypothetical protein